MIVVSTIDPPRMMQPCSSKIPFCAANSFSPSRCSSSKCSSVVASGTCSTVKFRPMNPRIA